MLRPSRLAVACASVALVGALAGAPTSAGAAADTITVIDRSVDVNPGETNPCTGATGTIVDDEQDVFHITTLADGTSRLTGHATVSVTFKPDDPLGITYAGHETFAVSETSTSRVFVTTLTNHVRVKGTDGTFLTLREVAHLTISLKGITAAFDRPELVCS
jgi:hypothetical protein